jgi:hypothetical protein
MPLASTSGPSGDELDPDAVVETISDDGPTIASSAPEMGEDEDDDDDDDEDDDE